MLGNTIHNRRSRSRVLVYPPWALGTLALTWGNGVGLCWEATQQGIARSGRENDLAEPGAVRLQVLFIIFPPFFCPAIPQKIQPLNHQFALPCTHRFW